MLVLYGFIFIVAIGLLGVFSATPLHAVMVALMLVALEVTLSFDNAIINARVLQKMSPKWQRRFLTWGIFSAVFLVRLVLPFLLVYWCTSLTMTQVWHYALYQPQLYHAALEQAFPYIAAFGSGFLLTVWLAFMYETKAHIWCCWIEQLTIWHHKLSGVVIILFAALMVAWLCDGWQFSVVFLAAALLQLGLHTLSHYLSHSLARIGQLGLAGFIYLEFLDASFSLDGVVGAFAITSDIATIMVGLGCGALLMRYFTIYCVKHAVIARWRYLEHGAHYGVLWLALILPLKIHVAIPEWLTGLGALSIITVSILMSLRSEPQRDQS